MISPIITVISLKEIVFSYCIEKGIEKLFKGKEEDFESRLEKTIDKTITRYREKYPVEDCNGKYAFYKSQKIIDELLKYRIMRNNYSISDLEKALTDETKIISPTKKEIENFYDIFIKCITEDEVLKQLEIATTFDDEIFEISRKIDDIHKNLENILNNFNLSLNSEWERQINVYKENIFNFKPITALDLLTQLESSVGSDHNTKAKIEYFKGECNSLIGDVNEMNKCYIRAYRLDQNPIYIKEKACLAFARNEKRQDAQQIIDNILHYDEYNSTAWATTIILSEITNITEQLAEVPKIVTEDINFKRIIYFNTKTKFDLEFYYKHSIIPKINDFEKTTVTYHNYKNILFIIDSTLTIIFKETYIDFQKVFSGDIDLIKSIQPIIENTIKRLSESEIIKNLKSLDFFNEYFRYIINEEEKSLIKMKLIYDNLEKTEIIIQLIIANCLQLANKEDEAILIINEHPPKDIDLLRLESFCYIKKHDIENYIKCSREIINKTEIITFHNCESILSIALAFNAYGKVDYIKIDEFTKDKTFEHECLRILTEEYILILFNNDTTEAVKKLQTIEEDLLKYNPSLVYNISYLYYTLKEYELSIKLFNKYIDKNNESRDLYYYIKSLDKAAIYNEELLKLLKYWRINFSFQEELLRIEADLRRQLADWEGCAEVCEYFLSKIKDDESFLTLHLLAINELDQPNKEVTLQEMVKLFSAFTFNQYINARIVSSILQQNNYHIIALNILYNFAKIKENKQARTDYFSACINIPKDIIKEEEIIKTGLFVKYEFNNEKHFIEINSNNPLSDSLINHKVGDNITVQRPMTNILDTIKVLRIMNKYLSLHDEILEEVASNPYSGIPIQSFKFEDTTPKGMKDTLVSLFGAEGTMIQKKRENAFIRYYNYNTSFSEIIIHNYGGEYIAGYFDLIHHHEGITQIPSILYPKFEINQSKYFVLDITSLLIFFQINREHNTKFQHKFIISKGIVDYIKDYKKKESSSIKEQLSIEISLDGVTKSTKPEELYKSNIQYLTKLLQWIEINCTVKIAESRLNVTRKLEGKIKNEFFANYITDNLSLVNEHNDCMLITDDSIYLKLLPLESKKITSAELYITSTFDSEHLIILELIKNKYIGISISTQMLISEFNKKIKEQINYYHICLNNISLASNPNTDNIIVLLHFLKEISQTLLFPDDLLKQEATNAFVILLKGQKNIKYFRLVAALINKEFKLLGIKLDIIRSSLNDAIMILGMSMQ